MKAFERTIEIEASPSEVWTVLTDLERFGEWNPYLVEVEGRAELGARLRVRFEPPGGRAATLRPHVTEIRTDEVLEWWGHVGLRGILDGRHRFELRATPAGTTFVQHETFTGLLLPFFAKGLADSTPAGFELMNQALKERAEKLHGGAAI
jgi:hypothetical protein